MYFIPFCLLWSFYGCGSKWSEEKAREYASRNLKHEIDINAYDLKDPYFDEHQLALKMNRKSIGSRFITSNEDIQKRPESSPVDKKSRLCCFSTRSKSDSHTYYVLWERGRAYYFKNVFRTNLSSYCLPLLYDFKM